MARSRIRYRVKAQPYSWGAPVVYKRKKKKKRNRYSRGLKDLQRAGNEYMKSANRLTRQAQRISADPFTVSAHVFTSGYRRRRRKTARKRRDGALVDLINNTVDSSADALGVFVPPINVVTTALGPTRFRRELMRQARTAMRLVIFPFR